jgi:hypothetical protein
VSARARFRWQFHGFSFDVRGLFPTIGQIWLALLLSVFPAQAETRWVGGYGLEVCQLKGNQFDRSKCAYLSTGREVDLTGTSRRDGSGEIFYELRTTDGALKGWISKSERDTALESANPGIGADNKQTSCIEPEIDMSEQEALASCWGKPRFRRRVGVEGLMRDQWVYGNGRNLYFDNGRLLAIEEGRTSD